MIIDTNPLCQFAYCISAEQALKGMGLIILSMAILFFLSMAELK